jgi:hypothetical protein
MVAQVVTTLYKSLSHTDQVVTTLYKSLSHTDQCSLDSPDYVDKL